MATIKAVIFKHKAIVSTQMCPIYIRLNHGQKRKYYAVGEFVLEKNWDAGSGLLKKSDQRYSTVNAIIRSMIRDIEKEVLNVRAKDSHADVIDEIRVNEQKEVMSDFFMVADMYFKELEQMEKYTRLSAEKPRINHLKKFNQNKPLLTQDIDVALLKKFQVFLKQNYGCSQRTIMNHLIVIRTLFNYAIRAKYVDSNLYPFGKGKIIIRLPESIKIGLTEQEVRLIENFDCEDQTNLQLAKDIWLFSFYLAGVRISDVFRLKWKDCMDNRLNYKMGKNNKVVSLRLPEKASEILSRYMPEELEYENYVFNILDVEDEDNARSMYLRITAGTREINRALKVIAQKIGLKKKLTCHISRHTFGHITADKISPQMLQKLYRHTDIKTTMSYQSNFIHKDVDEALETVLNF